uniref:Ig-like domain-containing protein n=1 Tax=Gouania willdenowi TaxID=441366 RepID=A0A8C5HNQ2_GOUWI
MVCLFFSMFQLKKPRRLISVNVGDNVTLQCLYEDDDDASLIYWYKQPLGKQPKIISTYLKYKKEGTFHDEFLNNTRLTLNMTDNTLYLKISDFSDTATYFCAHGELGKVTFEKGTRVRVKGSALDVKVSADGSASQSLNCTVFTGGCWDQLTLNVIQVSKTGRKRNITKTECVYSTVKN